MIVESDKCIFILDEKGDEITYAITSNFSDEWIVIKEDEYGDIFTRLMTKVELEEEYGKIPTVI